MQSKIFLAAMLLLGLNTSYALNCDATFISIPFHQVIISAESGNAMCIYKRADAAESIGFNYSNNSNDWFKPAAGNWQISSPRHWECTASNATECSFDKIN